MFDSLRELQATLTDVRGQGTLTEDDVDGAMREIRLALLEADVNFKVVKSFTAPSRNEPSGPMWSGSSIPASRWSRSSATS